MRILLLTLLLTGCASMDKAVCFGVGTCDRDPTYAAVGTNTVSSYSLNPTAPQTIVTSSGSYLIVPNYSSNSPLPAAILEISK